MLGFVVEAGLTAYQIYAATRFFGRRVDAPVTMIRLMIASIAAAAFLLIVSLGASAEPFAVEYGKVLLRSVIGAAIWIPYFQTSTRAALTFITPADRRSVT